MPFLDRFEFFHLPPLPSLSYTNIDPENCPNAIVYTRSFFEIVLRSRIDSKLFLVFFFFFFRSFAFEFTSRFTQWKRKRDSKEDWKDNFRYRNSFVALKSIAKNKPNKRITDRKKVEIFPPSKSLPVPRFVQFPLSSGSKFQIEILFRYRKLFPIFFLLSLLHRSVESYSFEFFSLIFLITGIIPWIRAYLLIPFLIFLNRKEKRNGRARTDTHTPTRTRTQSSGISKRNHVERTNFPFYNLITNAKHVLNFKTYNLPLAAYNTSTRVSTFNQNYHKVER